MSSINVSWGINLDCHHCLHHHHLHLTHIWVCTNHCALLLLPSTHESNLPVAFHHEGCELQVTFDMSLIRLLASNHRHIWYSTTLLSMNYMLWELILSTLPLIAHMVRAVSWGCEEAHRQPTTLVASRPLSLVSAPTLLIALFMTDSELLNLDSKCDLESKKQEKPMPCLCSLWPKPPITFITSFSI